MTTKPIRHAANPVPIPDPTPDAPEPIYDSVVEYVYELRQRARRHRVRGGASRLHPLRRRQEPRVWADVEVERPHLMSKVEPGYPGARRALSVWSAP